MGFLENNSGGGGGLFVFNIEYNFSSDMNVSSMNLWAAFDKRDVILIKDDKIFFQNYYVHR